MKKLFLANVFIIFLILSGCANEGAEEQKKVEITVSAAASLNDALTEIKDDFVTEHKQISVLFNIGGSGALKQQILQGAPTDIFISAANEHFTELTQKGLINKQEQVELLSNQLVLITNKEKPAPIKEFADLSQNEIKKIAIGTPESVPAGTYAKQTLQRLGLWDSVQSKTVLTKDVRQVLTYVETGNVDAGIVYMSDIKLSDKVVAVSIANEQYHDPIIYPAGIIKSSSNKKESTLFLNYLQSPSAKAIFKKYGFKVLD